MDPTPLARKLFVALDPPSLADNTADIDRLLRGFRQGDGLHPVAVDYDLLAPLSATLRASGWRVTALLSLAEERPRLLDLEPGDATARQAGLAVDLGTTTLVAELLDLATGVSLGQAQTTNPQTALGPDILTRLHAAKGPGLTELQGLVVSGINDLARRLTRQAGFKTADLIALSVAGNTTMTHLFLGLDPARICREPYIPLVNSVDPVPAGRLGLAAHPRAPVFVFPSVGSYFGGDLIAGLISSGLAEAEEIGLLVDVGTNAEVVVGHKDWLMGCAGAAGPALEGGVARMGLAAQTGAIERVVIDPASLAPTLSVIGPAGTPALGLCGSGLIDLVAQLYLAGVLDRQGKLLPLVHPRLRPTEDGWAYVVVQAGPGQDEVLFSQLDLDVLLRSKAAMYTILVTLLNQVGLTPADLAVVHVAGTFGQHIDPRSAIVIGMIPDLAPARFNILGNSSLAGAAQALLSAAARRRAAQVRERVTYLELNVNQEFMNRFSAAKFLPHTDLDLFPSVPPPIARPEPRLK